MPELKSDNEEYLKRFRDIELVDDDEPTTLEEFTDASAKEARGGDLPSEAIKDRIQDREERLKYAKHLFVMSVCWLFFIGIVVILQGSGIYDFFLSQETQTVLLATTTATIIGLFMTVAKYLFRR